MLQSCTGISGDQTPKMCRCPSHTSTQHWKTRQATEFLSFDCVAMHAYTHQLSHCDTACVLQKMRAA